MKRTMVLICLLLGSACGDDTAKDDREVGFIDAGQPSAPDARVVPTCQTAQPPSDQYGRCGAANSCNPPLCWMCAETAAGPTWTVAGDDGCNPSSCVPAREAWRADLDALDDSCTVDADCTVVASPGGCDVKPTITHSCGGDAVQKAALAASNLTARAASWQAACEHVSCGTLGCVADCAPSAARCLAGHCTTVERSCLPIPPDAGMQ